MKTKFKAWGASKAESAKQLGSLRSLSYPLSVFGHARNPQVRMQHAGEFVHRLCGGFKQHVLHGGKQALVFLGTAIVVGNMPGGFQDNAKEDRRN